MEEDAFIQAVVEIIADIKQPLVKVVSTAMKERARSLQLQLARVSVNLHECTDDLECAIKQQDYQVLKVDFLGFLLRIHFVV